MFPDFVHLYQNFGILTSSPAALSDTRVIPAHGCRLSKGELPLPLFTAGTGSVNRAEASVRDHFVVLVPSHWAPYTWGMLTVTAQVLSSGAVWFVPSATLTVTVALPSFTDVTRTVFSDTLTVATAGLLDWAEIAPSPGRVTVIVLKVVVLFSAMVDLSRVRLPAALAMVQVAGLEVVVPSAH